MTQVPKLVKGKKLGEGTYGIVYDAQCNEEHVVVKRNLVEMDADFIVSLRELHILRAIQGHPHMVTIKSVTIGDKFTPDRCMSPIAKDRKQKDDRIHFICEFADSNLLRWITESKYNYNYRHAKMMMVHILLGIEFLHGRGLIHRDIKPENMLIFFDAAGNPRLKICDFGLSKPYTRQGEQTPNLVTTWYRSPEVALIDYKYDYKADVWSVGCVFFELISKKAFLQTDSQFPNVVINKILAKMPEYVPDNVINDMIPPSNGIKLKNERINRKSFEVQLALSVDKRNQFCKELGPQAMNQFCALLKKMMAFDPNKRVTASEALNDDFFIDYRDYISRIRAEYPVVDQNVAQDFPLYKCIERDWMINEAFVLFNDRDTLEWYSHRILFQAIHLFDRYLAAMIPYILETTPNAVESETRGIVHSQSETLLRFYVCVYMSVKFFTTMKSPMSFNDILPKAMHSRQNSLLAEKFELEFIRDTLQYCIYWETPYEAADHNGEYLLDIDVRNLIVFYGEYPAAERCNSRIIYEGYLAKTRDDLAKVLTIS